MGATDVVPFVPLGKAAMADAVALARRLAERVWDDLQIPVYLYGEAALRPDRRRLADVRRGQYEGLKAEIGVNPDRDPDYGPSRLHPRGGAVAVGARKPLIAFNVNLRTDDLNIAKWISQTIRESSGGLPAIQAMGLLLEQPDEPTRAQVSLNLVDWERTGIATVVNEIRRLARERGTDIDHCELIGLAPTAALLEVAADALGLRDFTTDQALELRLARDR
jgi:glutamate formiminotransferase